MEQVYEYKVVKVPSREMVFVNAVFLNPVDYTSILAKNGLAENSALYLKINQNVVEAKKEASLKTSTVAVHLMLKESFLISEHRPLEFSFHSGQIEPHFELSMAKIQLIPAKKGEMISVDETEIEAFLKETYLNTIFNQDQFLPIQIGDKRVKGRVLQIQQSDYGLGNSVKGNSVFGKFTKDTEIEIESGGKEVKVNSSKIRQKNIFRQDFDFSSLGIGGLDKQFADIFRIAFASRRYPPSILEKMGVKHVKGMLLYGPPGTGKTLIARKLSQALNAKEIKKVNGPEIFDKFVGKSEENIRELFLEAEQDQRDYGEESELHVIIFDEFDAICKQRGSISSGTGVNDNVVNQLLTKIDGVDSLNNILLIGMTNRKDLIDEAILRPGRFELHVEIGLPDEDGRKQILDIHTKKMRENNFITGDFNIDYLAKMTKNFTGAEIASLVERASSFAFTRGIDKDKLTKKDEFDIQLTMEDFRQALPEIIPQFGSDELSMTNSMQFGIVDYPESSQIRGTINSLMTQIKESESARLFSVLLSGERGTGKTSLACKVAIESGFPFLKIISPEKLVGLTDEGKVMAITKIFEDAYKSPLSCIVLDELERLIGFVKIGLRFSNAILQALLVYIKKLPKEGRKIFIIGTTSQEHLLSDFELTDMFTKTVELAPVTGSDQLTEVLKEYCDESTAKACANLTGDIPIKKLMLVIDMAMQLRKGKLEVEAFKQVLNSL